MQCLVNISTGIVTPLLTRTVEVFSAMKLYQVIIRADPRGDARKYIYKIKEVITAWCDQEAGRDGDMPSNFNEFAEKFEVAFAWFGKTSTDEDNVGMEKGINGFYTTVVLSDINDVNLCNIY